MPWLWNATAERALAKLLAGCDPATSLLARMVERLSGIEIVHAPASSQLALDWLEEGKVHIAGSHLQDPDSSEFNLPFIRRQFPNQDMAVVTFARWEEGLVVARGNAKSIRNVEDLQRKNINIVNREPGSGSRALLDDLIRSAGVAAKTLRGYDRVAFGHLSAAHEIHDLNGVAVTDDDLGKSMALDDVSIVLDRNPARIDIEPGQQGSPPICRLGPEGTVDIRHAE